MAGRLPQYAQHDRLVEETIPQLGEDVRSDLTKYAGKLVAIPEVKSFLTVRTQAEQSMQSAEDQFVVDAVEKAKGNLGYLDAVGRAIDQAIASNDPTLLKGLIDLRLLPDTLQDLYGHFLKLLRQSVGERSLIVEDPVSHQQGRVMAWINVYRPVLGVLAVAMEPLTSSQIRNLSRTLAGEDDVSEAIGRLRQFLDERGGRYTFYHATLPEFLVAETTRQNPQYQELAVKPAIWHGKIVVSCRGQAATWDQVDWRTVDDYGLRYVIMHMYALYNEYLFSVELDFVGELDAEQMPTALRDRFGAHDCVLTPDALVEVDRAGSRWAIVDVGKRYVIRREIDALDVRRNGNNLPFEIYDLMCKPFVQAKLAFTGSVYAVAQDIELVIEVSKDEKPPNWVQLIRNSLLFAKLITWTANAPATLLAALTQLGKGRMACGYAALIQDPVQRSNAYLVIAEALMYRSEKKVAAEMLEEALEVADRISGGEEEKDIVISGIAVALARLGRVQYLQDVVNKIKHGQAKANALTEAAAVLAQAGDIFGAKAMAQVIDPKTAKAQALSYIAVALAGTGDVIEAEHTVKEAFDLANSVWTPFDRDMRAKAEALSDVAIAFAAIGDCQRGQDAIRQAETAVERIQSDRIKATALGNVALSLVKINEIGLSRKLAWQALALASQIGDESHRAEAKCLVALALAKSGDVNGALSVATFSPDDVNSTGTVKQYQVNAKIRFASELAEFGFIEEALKVVHDTHALVDALRFDNKHKADVLSNLAVAYLRLDQKDIGQQLVNEVLTKSMRQRDGWCKAEALIGLAASLASSDDLDRSLQIIDELQSEVSTGQIVNAWSGLQSQEPPESGSAIMDSLRRKKIWTPLINMNQRGIEVIKVVDASQIQIPNEAELVKAYALSCAAQQAAQCGRKEIALKLATEVLTLLMDAATIKHLTLADEFRLGLDPGKAIKLEAMTRIAKAFAEGNEVDKALALVESKQSDIKPGAIIATAAALVRDGKIERALSMIDRNWSKVLVKGGYPHFAGVFPLSVDREDQGKWYKTCALSCVAQALVLSGNAGMAEQMARQALTVAESMTDAILIGHAMSSAAEALVKAGQSSAARKVAYQALSLVNSVQTEELGSAEVRTPVETRVPVELQSDEARAREDHLEQVRQHSVEALESAKACALGRIAVALAVVGQTEDSLNLVDKIWCHEIVRTHTLSEIAKVRSKPNDVARIEQRLAGAFYRARLEGRNSVFAIIVPTVSLLSASEQRKDLWTIYQVIKEAEDFLLTLDLSREQNERQ